MIEKRTIRLSLGRGSIVFVFLVLAQVASAATAWATPTEKYRQAIEARAQGDSKGYFDILLDLASTHPTSRAGRRARAILTSSDAIFPIILGGLLQSKVSDENADGQKTDQEEDIPQTMERILRAQRDFRTKNGRFCENFQECGLSGPINANLVFFMGPKAVIGGGGPEDPDGLRLQALATMRYLGVLARSSKDGFLAVGLSNSDKDSDLEVWTIDHTGRLLHILAD